ncbi:MAG: glycerophosphodiester phosphodiesterase family protein [Chloroherpetonaceae bacterium]
MKSLKEYFQENNFIVVAHRGASGLSPENTISACIEALKYDIKIIEVDVRLTKDNEIVVFHDELLARIANLDKSIEELTTDEIKNIDVGTWFSEKFNEKIPTLKEIIDTIRDKAYLIIELKTNNNREVFIDKLFEIIKSTNYHDHVMLVSFDPDLLQIARKYDKEILTCIIKDPNSNVLPHELLSQTQSDGVICSFDELTDEFISDKRKYKIPVGVYDVDTMQQLEKCLEANIYGIGTNFPEAILKNIEK